MGELFDLYDASGQPLGLAKERALVHRDGDWHRSIHLWIVRTSGGLIFQRRSAAKDTWPNRLAVSVGGHYAAGEGLLEVLREAREEIGIPVDVAALLSLGTVRYDGGGATGVIDRELQDVFFWPMDTPLGQFRPDPVELAGVAELRAADLLALLDGTVPSIPAAYAPAGSGPIGEVSLTLDDFEPSYPYFRGIATAVLTWASGEHPSLG